MFFVCYISGSYQSYRSSPLWNYFIPPLQDNKFATCKICWQEKSMGSADPTKRTLSNLKTHIRMKHIADWEILKNLLGLR